jgi:hypothetical protein
VGALGDLWTDDFLESVDALAGGIGGVHEMHIFVLVGRSKERMWWFSRGLRVLELVLDVWFRGEWIVLDETQRVYVRNWTGKNVLWRIADGVVIMCFAVAMQSKRFE